MEKKLVDIEEDIKELTEYIKDSDTYKRYLLLRDKIYNDETIMNMINDVKKNQKSIINLKYNKKDYSKEEKEIERLLKELNNYPVYIEYNYLVEDLNTTMSYIKENIEDSVNKIVN